MPASHDDLGLGEHPVHAVIGMLERRGWTRISTEGSHSSWRGPHGTTFTLPDGHDLISQGVFRRLPAALSLDEDR